MQCQIIVLLVSLIGISSQLSCFQCTTLENSNCAVNDASALTEYKKACPPLADGQLKGTAAVGCRKTTQFVAGEESVVRECAYTGGPVDGLKKTGNHGIKLYYYQCENTKDSEPCNSVSTTSIVTILLVPVIASFFQ